MSSFFKQSDRELIGKLYRDNWTPLQIAEAIDAPLWPVREYCHRLRPVVIKESDPVGEPISSKQSDNKARTSAKLASQAYTKALLGMVK